MSIVVSPQFPIGSFKWYLEYNDIEARSAFGAQTVRIGEPVWRASFQVDKTSNSVANTVAAFIDELSGKQNQAALYHVATPVPIGTLRGVNTLYSAAAQGATSMVVSATSTVGSTLLKGDLIGIGTGYNRQVLRVITSTFVDINNRITISFLPRLRVPFSIGEAITWDKPTALFRQETTSTGGQYVPGLLSDGAAFDFREDWRP